MSPGRTIDPAVVAGKVIELTQAYNVLQGLAYDPLAGCRSAAQFDRLGFAAWEDKGGEKTWFWPAAGAVGSGLQGHGAGDRFAGKLDVMEPPD